MYIIHAHSTLRSKELKQYPVEQPPVTHDSHLRKWVCWITKLRRERREKQLALWLFGFFSLQGWWKQRFKKETQSREFTPLFWHIFKSFFLGLCFSSLAQIPLAVICEGRKQLSWGGQVRQRKPCERKSTPFLPVHIPGCSFLGLGTGT